MQKYAVKNLNFSRNNACGESQYLAKKITPQFKKKKD